MISSKIKIAVIAIAITLTVLFVWVKLSDSSSARSLRLSFSKDDEYCRKMADEIMEFSSPSISASRTGLRVAFKKMLAEDELSPFIPNVEIFKMYEETEKHLTTFDQRQAAYEVCADFRLNNPRYIVEKAKKEDQKAASSKGIESQAQVPVSPVSPMEAFAKEKQCLTCHAIDKRLVGPSFREVAQKYRGNPTAKKTLAKKVVKGGVGVWGPIPKPAEYGLSNEDARRLTEWVLSLE